MIGALLGVVKGRVPLAEGPATAVLSGQTHGCALDEERAEGERLGKRPVIGSAIAQDFEPAVDKHAAHFGQNVKTVRHTAEPLDHFTEQLRPDRRADRFVGIGRLEHGGGTGKASAFLTRAF